MRKRKKQVSTPRCKRHTRSQRLAVAANWIKAFQGRNLVRGYQKHFAVNALCSAIELRMLGYDISDEVIAKLRKDEQCKQEIALQKKMQQEIAEHYTTDLEAQFYFIADYTSGGFPYGIRFEEIADTIPPRVADDYADCDENGVPY